MGKLRYTKALGEALARAAQAPKHSRFSVIPWSGKWAVVSNGVRRALRVFVLREDAISFAKKYAISKSAEVLVIHTKDTRIEKIFYLNEKVA